MNGSLPAALVVAILLVLLVVAVAALALAVVALRRGRPGRRLRVDPATVPADVAGLRGEVQALRGEVAEALRHLAVVRYDAFGDMGGRMSWSVAVLDDRGNGVVLTSIHGRSEARTYAKGVTGWVCEQALSPEEEQAVTLAKAG